MRHDRMGWNRKAGVGFSRRRIPLNFPWKKTGLLLAAGPVFWMLFLSPFAAVPFTRSLAMAQAASADEVEEEQGTMERVEESVDAFYAQTSESILISAKWLDSFFRTETYESEENRTRMKVTLSVAKQEYEDWDSKVDVNLRLNLPGTENRLSLLISGDSEDDGDSVNPFIQDIRSDASDWEDSLTIGLQSIFFENEDHSLKMTGKVLWRDGHPAAFVGPRYRFNYREWDPWKVRLEQYVRWYTDEGFEARTRINFDRPLPWWQMLFRIRPGLDWSEEEDGVRYGLGFSVFHPLSENRGLQYQFNNGFDSEVSGQLDEINLTVRYRQRVWREWFTYEVTPQVAWKEEHDFDTSFGLYIGIEGWFGNWKRKK